MFDNFIRTITAFLGLHNPYERRVFLFNGWLNETAKAFQGGSIELMDDEIRAGRRQPGHPDGVLVIQAFKKEFVEPGDRMQVLMDPAKVTSESVVAYFAALGIPAAPEKLG